MKTLNDQVDEIHRRLIDDEKYRALLKATRNADAVEGLVKCDDALAAKMIFEEAKRTGIVEVAQVKIADIVKALRVVLRRYGMSRKQRRAELNCK